jgi:hypothetical protein
MTGLLIISLLCNVYQWFLFLQLQKKSQAIADMQVDEMVRGLNEAPEIFEGTREALDKLSVGK